MLRNGVAADFFLILPEVELVLFGLAILLIDFLLGMRQKACNALIAMLGVIFSGISLYRLRAYASAADRPVVGFFNSIVVDPFFLFFGLIFLVATALVILLSVRYLQIEDEHHGEYYALLLFATVGMMFMACGLRSDRAVPGPGNHGHQLLRAERVSAARAALERSRGEVSAAGRVQLGDAGLRLFACSTASRHGRSERAWRRPLKCRARIWT